MIHGDAEAIDGIARIAAVAIIFNMLRIGVSLLFLFEIESFYVKQNS